MFQNKSSTSVKENYLFNGTDLNIKVNINQKDFLEKKEGDIIYQKGENAEFVFLIIDGEVKTKITGVFSSPVVVKSGKNEFFGEKELLENTKRTSSAVANTDCLLYRLDKSSLNGLIHQNKIIKKNLFRSLQFDEPEEIDGQKEFFIKTEDSPEKFTFLPEEEGKKEDVANEVEEIRPLDMEPLLAAEEPFEEDIIERDKEIITKLYETSETDLKWDFISSKSPGYAASPKIVPEGKKLSKETESIDSIKTKKEDRPGKVIQKEYSIEDKSQLLKKITGFIEKDIRYPVLTLKFYAEQIKKKEISKEINEVVDLLIEQANIISDTVETANSFAQNKSSLNLEPVSINAALDEILGVLADYVESQNSRLYKKYETTALVNLDKRQLYQAIFQVMKNACEAMPEGGNVYVISKSEGGHIKIEIKNNGKNIPRELHTKIFEPFFSFEKDDAAGIGLSIADRIIKDHGGSIMIDSESEETHFIISIPVAE